MKRTLLFSLVVLYVLHNDLWLWHDARLVLGLPVGLFYHLVFCLIVVAVMALLVRFAWPGGLDEGVPTEGSRHNRS